MSGLKTHVLVTWEVQAHYLWCSLFYRYSQRLLIIGWKLKENTATPNHEHSNQRQQLIHIKKICPFQGRFFKAVSAKLPLHPTQRFPRWKLHLFRWYNGVRAFERTRTHVHILIFVTKIHFSLVGGTEMLMWLHTIVAK